MSLSTKIPYLPYLSWLTAVFNLISFFLVFSFFFLVFLPYDKPSYALRKIIWLFLYQGCLINILRIQGTQLFHFVFKMNSKKPISKYKTWFWWQITTCKNFGQNISPFWDGPNPNLEVMLSMALWQKHFFRHCESACMLAIKILFQQS